MSTVYRICPECGEQGELDTRHCGACGYDMEGGLPAPKSNLRVSIGKAALPVLAGAASLAIRAGWKLIQYRLNQMEQEQNRPSTTNSSTKPQPRQPQDEKVTRKSRRKIHIRSSWNIGNSTGHWQQGSSEHTIEFDD